MTKDLEKTPVKKSYWNTLRFNLLIWFLALSLLPLILTSVIDYHQTKKSAIDLATSEIEQSSHLTKKFISSWFYYRYMDIEIQAKLNSNKELLRKYQQSWEQSELPLSKFVKSKQWNNIAQKNQTDLTSLKLNLDYIYDVFLIDLSGNILFTLAQESDLGENLFTEKYNTTKFSAAVQKTLKNNKTSFSGLTRYEPSNNVVAGFLTAPITDDNNKAIGVIAIQLSIDRIFNSFKDTNTIKRPIKHYLVGNDGVLRTPIKQSWDNVLNKSIETKQVTQWINSQNTEQENNINTTSIYKGPNSNVIGMSQSIKVGDVTWGLISEMDEENILVISSSLFYNMFISIIFTIIIVIFISFFVTKRLTTPIAALAKASKEFSQGKVHKITPNQSSHEINQLIYSFNTMLDLRHSHEQQLEKASLIAEQNSHLKSEFLATMSHEIRTPMNGVLGMLGLLLNSNLNKDQEDKANLAKSSAESLLILINDILDFSKVEAGKLTLELIDFDLRKMLGDFCDSMALNAQEKGIELILDVTNVEQSMVKGDSGRIRQILTNLVSNAIKFTPAGEILITVSTTTDINQKLSLSCVIQDTGIGIPENKISILFDKFTQVDASTTREFGGTGLGLAITKKLCLLMNGDITVKSTIGDGSQFTFTVQLDSSKKSTQVLPTFNINKLNILIVDDNDTNRKVLNGQLTHWGATVTEATSANEALHICQQYGNEHSNHLFDIALLDMQMPVMNGADLGKVLQEKFKAMKLVMMTSITTENETQYFADIGFSGFFTKPATTSDLFDALAIISEDGNALKQATPLVTHEYIRSLDRTKKNLPTQLSAYTWPKETRLLIVEDNRINQQVALGILKEFNLTADIAGNGLEAITAIKTAPKYAPYTLIIMDCQMPEMDGYDATINIRNGKAGQKNINIPIIAMTANAMEGDKEKCINVGMSDYISKPIEPDQLIKKIQYWLIEHQGLEISEFVNQNIESSINDEQTTSEVSTQNNENDSTSEKTEWDIETALSRVRDNKKLLAKLVSLYLEDMPGHIKDLQQALQDKNIKIVKLTAHSIRGASGNLYAYRMQDLAKSIETYIIENIDSVNFEKLTLMASSFDDEFTSLQKHFNAFIKEA